MKLQRKISIYFFSVSLIIFLLSSVVSYVVIKSLVLEEVDETLEAEKNNLVTQLQQIKNPNNLLENHSYRLDVHSIDPDKKIAETLSDTLIFVGEEGDERVPFRQIKLSQNIAGKNYLLILRRSLIEREDLITGITVLLGLVFFLIFLSLNLISYFGEKKWWQPFYDTLQKLSSFNLAQKDKLNFSHSGIDEFNKLNESLDEMTEKMRTDYTNLKEFSENASHEMQTPLAIIRSKLDVMIQDKSLSEKQFDSIRSLYGAVNRLNKLNQSLNLLTKIENREFDDREDVNFSELVRTSLNNLEEIIKSKSLKLRVDLTENIMMRINPFIAETLISNLLTNAIKHNIENGKIFIKLTDDNIEIKNTGKPPQVSPEKFFARFKKDAQTSDSPGLGLSIVKKICELNNFNIEYNFINNLHNVCVKFNSQ